MHGMTTASIYSDWTAAITGPDTRNSAHTAQPPARMATLADAKAALQNRRHTRSQSGELVAPAVGVGVVIGLMVRRGLVGSVVGRGFVGR